jgi:hypothetical protein
MSLDDISMLDVLTYVSRGCFPRYFSLELRDCVGKSLFDLPLYHLFEGLMGSSFDGKLAHPAPAV